MALTISKSFTAVGTGGTLLVRPKSSFNWAVSGTFVGTWILETSSNGGQGWIQVASGSAAATGDIDNTQLGSQSAQYRFHCLTYTSGTIVTAMTEDDTEIVDTKAQDGSTLMGHKASGKTMSTFVRTLQKRLSNASIGHVGATSGFVTNAAADTNLVTCPASKTASTFVIPVSALKVGDTITGFHLIGEVTSGGGALTVDCSLFKHTAASGTDAAASLQAMTQIAVSAAGIIDETNSLTQLATQEVVGTDKSYFYLVTVTTASGCTVTLQAAATVVTET